MEIPGCWPHLWLSSKSTRPIDVVPIDWHQTPTKKGDMIYVVWHMCLSKSSGTLMEYRVTFNRNPTRCFSPAGRGWSEPLVTWWWVTNSPWRNMVRNSNELEKRNSISLAFTRTAQFDRFNYQFNMHARLVLDIVTGLNFWLRPKTL